MEGDTTAAREIAALNTRDAKSEPPLRDLLAGFAQRAGELGITPEYVAAMQKLGDREILRIYTGHDGALGK